MKRRFRTNLKPRTETKMLAVKSAHPNGTVSSTDSHRSSMGILKGKLQHTLSVAPSLLYYFSQYCGISFDESAELLKAGRLYAGGKPLQGLQALTVQVPMSIIPQLELEVVTLDGHLVPAAQRQFHRYYGFMNLGSSTTVTTDEKEPRSFIFRVRKLSPTPLPRHVGRRRGGAIQRTSRSPVHHSSSRITTVMASTYCQARCWSLCQGCQRASGDSRF
jgi:hypothetical protein